MDEPTFADVLQGFCKYFQRNVVPMPSFSKECFGGFVEFQRVTIDPNALLGSPTYAARARPKSSAPDGLAFDPPLLAA
jgi:hypothetical protein